jgi:4-oxalocrotonate tautomerase family enzyme
MPFVQVTIAAGLDAQTKRELVTQISHTAAKVTDTPEDAFRVWIVEVDPNEVSVGGTILADKRQASGT